MNNLYQNYQNLSYFQQPQNQAIMRQQPIVQQTPYLKGRLVSSFDEARAATIDFDGSVFYFPDLANRRIYTKQINLDGTSTINMYELKEMPIQNNVGVIPNTDAFITREEFEIALNKIREDLLTAQTANKKAVETIF